MGSAPAFAFPSRRAAGTDAGVEPIFDPSTALTRLPRQPSWTILDRKLAGGADAPGRHNLVHESNVAGELLASVFRSHHSRRSSPGAGARSVAGRAPLGSPRDPPRGHQSRSL